MDAATRCYYFILDDIKCLFGKNKKMNKGGEQDGVPDRDEAFDDGMGTSMFSCNGAGLDILELKYIQRVYKNRSQEANRRRVWVQGRFRKPFG